MALGLVLRSNFEILRCVCSHGLAVRRRPTAHQHVFVLLFMFIVVATADSAVPCAPARTICIAEWSVRSSWSSWSQQGTFQLRPPATLTIRTLQSRPPPAHPHPPIHPPPAQSTPTHPTMYICRRQCRAIITRAITTWSSHPRTKTLTASVPCLHRRSALPTPAVGAASQFSLERRQF
jgi:hypothetical protein